MTTSRRDDALATEPSADVTATVDSDLPCRCGYNLRGLAISGRCPECGATILSNPWRYVLLDRRWALRALTGIPMSAAMVPPMLQVLMQWGDRLLYRLVPVAVAVGFAGVWLLSSRRPAFERERTTIVVLRWLVRLTCGVWLGVTILIHVGRESPFRASKAALLYWFLNMATVYLTFAQFENVAHRAALPGLARTFVVLRGLAPILVATPITLYLARDTFGAQIPDEAFTFAIFSQFPLGFVILFVLGRLYQGISAATPPRLR
jgi:hypothetical protein